MDEIIQALQDSSIYNHEVYQFSIVETHISWILLTGLFAYKIKKPVNLGFVDYSTLAKRKYFCELELVLNKKLAPNLYLDVFPLARKNNKIIFDSKSPPVEYVIKMHQFDESQMLNKLCETEGLSKGIVRSLATQIADFHKNTEIAPKGSIFGTHKNVFQMMLDNFSLLSTCNLDAAMEQKIKLIEQWTHETYTSLHSVLEQRKEIGHIKACHGDLHLGNIVLIQGNPTIFDCIEFNDNLRFTDVIADIAFLAMDLDHKSYHKLSNFFVNHYLELTQDYPGATLLSFYKAYRAMVRAKICAIQFSSLEKKDTLLADFTRYLDIAIAYQAKPGSELIITHGPSGSGKSFYTEALLETNTLRLSADVFRKQLFHLKPYALSPLSLRSNLYSEKTTKEVYRLLYEQADYLLSRGFRVIVDATFLKQWQRQQFLQLSVSHNIPFKILDFPMNMELLKSRIVNKADPNASDADMEVLRKQLNALEPLTEYEKSFVEVI
ncbi:MAG TPA: AAA family ATPase [Gammaproteobacteria bacterium]|nr:AAA family ATPase [Gammaproteobacteria bacterium]